MDLTIVLLCITALLSLPTIISGTKKMCAVLYVLWSFVPGSHILKCLRKAAMYPLYKARTGAFFVGSYFGPSAWAWRWKQVKRVWASLTVNDLFGFLAWSTLIVYLFVKVKEAVRRKKQSKEGKDVEEEGPSEQTEWLVGWSMRCVAVLSSVAFFQKWATPIMSTLSLFRIWDQLGVEGQAAKVLRKGYTTANTVKGLNDLAKRLDAEDDEALPSHDHDRVSSIAQLGAFLEQGQDKTMDDTFANLVLLSDEVESIQQAEKYARKTKGSIFWFFWVWKQLTSAQRRLVVHGCAALVVFLVAWPLYISPFIAYLHAKINGDVSKAGSKETKQPTTSKSKKSKKGAVQSVSLEAPNNSPIMVPVNRLFGVEIHREGEQPTIVWPEANKGKTKGRAQEWKERQRNRAAHHKNSSVSTVPGSRAGDGLEYAFEEYTLSFLKEYGVDNPEVHYKKLRAHLSARDLYYLSTLNESELDAWMLETFNDYPYWDDESLMHEEKPTEESNAKKNKDRKKRQKAKKIQVEGPIGRNPAVPEDVFDAELQLYDSKGNWHGGATMINHQGKLGIQTTKHQMTELRRETQGNEIVAKCVRDSTLVYKFAMGKYGEPVEFMDYVFIPGPSNVSYVTGYKRPTELGLLDGNTSIVIRWLGLNATTNTDKVHTAPATNWVPMDTIEFDHMCSTNPGASGSGIYAFCYKTNKWWLIGCNRGKVSGQQKNKGMGTFACLNRECPKPSPTG